MDALISRRTAIAGAAALGFLPFAASARDIAMQGFTRTRGGQSGQLMRVTSLASTGPGTLRAALEAEGPRIIRFEVGGVIDLGRGSLSIRNPFVTIDGESAPSPGITIIRGGIGIATHDVVIRHIRVRAGADGAAPKSGWEVDGISTTAGRDVVIDHCSVYWATDENLSASGPRFDGGEDVAAWRAHTSGNISFTNNIVAEGLSNSSHAKGEHSKGSLIHDNVTGAFIARNLYAHNYERNQLFKGGVQAVSANNLIYDPGNRCMHYALNEEEWIGHRWVDGELAIVGNVVRGGPSTRADLPFLIVEGQGDLRLFAQDNRIAYADGRPMLETQIISNRQPKIKRLSKPSIWPSGFKVLPSAEVEEAVLAEVGARPFERDAHDKRIISQVMQGKGRIIDDEREVSLP